MTTPPLGPSGALKVAMELIDAQAAHIKQLERGHWGRETRHRVEELRDELEIVTAAENAPVPIRPFTNAEYDGIALPAIEGLKDYRQEQDCPQAGPAMSYAEAAERGLVPDLTKEHPAPLFDKGGELPTIRVGEPLSAGDTLHITHHEGEDPEVHVTKGPSLAAQYIDAYTRLQTASEAAPEHAPVPHLTDAWAAKGQCQRCDTLQPLHDAEQAAHQALIRHNHGIPPEGENRP
jgi:hypothetical protein